MVWAGIEPLPYNLLKIIIYVVLCNPLQDSVSEKLNIQIYFELHSNNSSIYIPVSKSTLGQHLIVNVLYFINHCKNKC